MIISNSHFRAVVNSFILFSAFVFFGFTRSFDAQWSEWPRITDPDPDHLEGTHPKWRLAEANITLHITHFFFSTRLFLQERLEWRPQMWRQARNHSVVAEWNTLQFALKQSQFSKFLLFFHCWYCTYSLSFMKASIKIATRLNSTTVCRPLGLPQFARVGGPEYV